MLLKAAGGTLDAFAPAASFAKSERGCINGDLLSLHGFWLLLLLLLLLDGSDHRALY